jgi:hypothetical protein
LIPRLLQKCFPAEQVKDILWIGMSVRDACIVPVMKKANRMAALSKRTHSSQAKLIMVAETKLAVRNFAG